MKKRHSTALWVACLFALLVPGLAKGQSTNATLSGTIVDPTGAAVPNVQLTLNSVALGTVTKIRSGPDGLYSFPNLRPGIYELRVHAQGFKDYVQTGIELTMNAMARQDVKLQLGTAVETVEVRANASPLNTDDAQVKGSVTPLIRT